MSSILLHQFTRKDGKGKSLFSNLKPKIQLSGKERSNGLAIWVGQDI